MIEQDEYYDLMTRLSESDDDIILTLRVGKHVRDLTRGHFTHHSTQMVLARSKQMTSGSLIPTETDLFITRALERETIAEIKKAIRNGTYQVHLRFDLFGVEFKPE